ncbi:hypothetical protein WJX74_003856 [Apatococcus lobatus]|uniref:BTB domain-containing protein n=1 Tax=Apatococcus lobatus TaxID=904363 RepID=A0AAW1QYD9_9CHLO
MKLTYLEHTAPGYEDLADLTFVVKAKRLPVHSQLLARESRVIADLLRSLDQPPTWRSPFVLEEGAHFECEVEELLLFLNVIYRNSGDSAAPASVAEACAVYRLADFFDANRVLERASGYLRQPPHNILTATVGQNSPVRWLLVADRLKLHEFGKVCLTFILLHFDTLCDDPLLEDLPAALLLELLRRTHQRVPKTQKPIPLRALPSHFPMMQ